jgi:hypothetical protein
LYFELEADRDKFDLPPTPESPYTVAEQHIAEIRHQVRELGKNKAKTVLRIGPKIRNWLRAARSIYDKNGPFLESKVFAKIVDQDPTVGSSFDARGIWTSLLSESRTQFLTRKSVF